MRLPTITVGQQQAEDSRQLHERLYAAYVDGQQAIEWPVPAHTTSIDELQRVSGNTHKFWYARGFRVRTKVVHRHLLNVWLEPKTGTAQRGARQMATNRVRKVGPAILVQCVDCGWRAERRRDWVSFSLGTCRECQGEMQPRTNTRAHVSDAKAKRELAEQEGAA